MVFSSSIFLFLFLPLVIAGYYLLVSFYRFDWFNRNIPVYFLMLASLFFYAWGEPVYVLVMLLSILINYFFGLFIYASIERQKRTLAKIFLALSVIANLGILFYFKYLNFTLDTANRFFKTSFALRDIVMPIGISFFTFQGMSYVIDLYRQRVGVQRNLFKLAFYISFFPQLIAGPIVRYIDIEKQLFSRKETLEKFASGAGRFIIGLAKKVIIANNLGYVADMIFAVPAVENSVAAAWLGIISYSFQIYFDFSGYSDMAIGLGRLFGFEFLENFNYPYISKTITEFWRRWHISLSSWFRDYVYIPLGGNRTGNVYFNLFLVFVLTGFWHGASFHFLVWGLWHGFFLTVERFFGQREVQNKKLIPLRYIFTLLIVVIGWVFFRSPGLRYAVSYLAIMFGVIKPENVSFHISYYLSSSTIVMLCLAMLASTPVLKHVSKRIMIPRNAVFARYVSSALLLLLFFVCIVLVTTSSYNPFIYFRF